MGNETPTYIICPHCGKKVLMDWTCSECKKAIAYDIVDNFVRTNPHKPETDRKQEIATRRRLLCRCRQLFCNNKMIDEFIGG